MKIENENEAIVSILVASVYIDDELTEYESEKIASILVYCRKFQDLEIIAFIRKAIIMKMEYDSIELIRRATPFIEENFLKTLYCMICDLLCADGKTSESDIQLMAMIATELQLSEEEYLPIASTFMARYIWNIHVS
jgi:uncharacterized tellurite resistance protein B-like protein